MTATLAVLFSRNKYAKGQVGSVVFDTVVIEEHNFVSRVTNYPVEQGSLGLNNIYSDHIINEPDRVTLHGLVSDTPLNIFALFNRSIQAFNALVEIHENRQIVNVVTGLKVYPTMAITALHVPRNIKTGQSLTFTVELQRIILNTTQLTLLDQNDTAAGVMNLSPRETVRSNANIPVLMNDPPDSLKDQASAPTDYGVQSLQDVPLSNLPNVVQMQNVIAGAY